MSSLLRVLPTSFPTAAGLRFRLESQQPLTGLLLFGRQKMASRPVAMARIQEFVAEDPKGGWKKAWDESLTPWDLGHVTPAVADLIDGQQLPLGSRILVPGCGTGYDVIALAGDDRFAVGLDIADTAVEAARKNAEGSASSERVQFLCQDFFSFAPSQPFDVVFDYTFFCALNPSMRPQWAKKTSELVSPSGKLFTLMFPIDDHEGGPPFAVSHAAYADLLEPYGFVPRNLPTRSHPSREGREQLVEWTRPPSSL